MKIAICHQETCVQYQQELAILGDPEFVECGGCGTAKHLGKYLDDPLQPERLII